MRASIDSLRTSIERSDGLLGQLHNAGFEVGEDQLRLREAQNHLTLARTEVHTFRGLPVEKVVGEGLAITTRVEAAAQQGFGELPLSATRPRGFHGGHTLGRGGALCSRFETWNAAHMSHSPVPHRRRRLSSFT